jgi:hypothetical protein
MNDCSNAEIRDQLPDLLHERLDASSRAVVVAHVAQCVDCRDELELLRSVQKTLIALTPRVDISYVVGALPKAPVRRAPVYSAPRRRWIDWRVAAAVTVLVAGGSSVVGMRQAPTTADNRPAITDSSANRSAAPIDNAALPGSPASPSVAIASGTGTSESVDDEGLDSRFGGLSDDQMQTLLAEIDGLEAVPVTEPEPVSIRVDLKPGSPEGVP